MINRSGTEPQPHNIESRLIDSVRTNSGWYTTLPSHRPDVYSSYHFSVICNLFFHAPYETGDLKDLLVEQIRSDFESNSIGSLSGLDRLYLRDYHNAVNILTDGGNIPADRVREAVAGFRTLTGAYTASRERDSKATGEGSLLATAQAISIHSMLGDPVDGDTVAWTRRRWNEIIDSPDGDLRDARCVLNALASTGVAPSSHKRYNQWRRETIKRINDSLTGQEIIPNVLVKTLPSIIRDTDITTTEISELTPDMFSETQYPDGGYNALNQEYSEPHGTADLVRLANLFDALDALDTRALTNFVAKYSLPTGGFGKVADKNGRVDSSYFATKIKRELGETVTGAPLPPTTLRKLLSSHRNMEIVYKTWLFTTGGAQATSAVKAYIASYLEMGDFDPQRLLQTLYVREMISHNNDRQYKKKLLNAARVATPLRPPAIRTDDVAALYQKVSIRSLLEMDIPNQAKIVERLRDHRIRSIGFAVTSEGGGRHPNLCTTYQGLRTLSILDESVEDSDDLSAWIWSHRSPNGGFQIEKGLDDPCARSLQATFWGIASLNLMDGKPVDRDYK